MKRQPQLHELLAVMADTLNAATAIRDETDETKVTFEKKPDHFRGHTRSVNFLDAGRAGENVIDTKQLVTTVSQKLEHTFGVISQNFDALLQQEEANTRAFADLIVDGKVVAEHVPATFLLGMESCLKQIREVLLLAPTLDPALKWELDEATGSGVYRANTTATFKTEKKMNSKVLYDATDKHPAQVEKWSEDVPVARIETVQISGMISPAYKSDMIARCDTLIAAVKQARQRANCVEVSNLHLADTLFSYITG